ncbi:beta strand repeat-containing protein [Flavobacterium aestuarii]|uniref:beta strand repeat-containing protein n=1 Tax=Flavobacterium aestuarii TaxID=3149227 RepID=UPI0032B5863F
MKLILPKSKILLAFLVFIFIQATGFGAVITSTGTGGNWDSGSSWQGGIVPSATDDVVIAAGSTVTVNVNVSAKSITVSGTMSIPSDSNISINSLLVVITSPSGNIYFNKKSIITFPANVSLYLQNGTNSLNTGGSGVCSNNTEIHVGTTNYAVCTGGGATYTFDQVETAGGINTAIILSGNQYICTNGTNTTTFTSTVSGGSWSSGSPSIATVNSSTGVVTGLAAGNATITYTVAGVGSATRDVYVAGGPGGGVSAINGSSSQCAGSTANYTITSNNANYNHTWSYASGTGVTFVTSADGRSATATFASNATSGQITVNSTNACGSGYGNNFNVTVIPVPSAPGTAAPNSPSCTQFTAQWAFTSSATKYYIDVSTNSGFSSFVSGYNNLDVGNVTSYVLTGLNPGTTYYYRVRAYNNCGTSPSSTTMNYATTASPTVAPTVTAATSIDCNQAVLNWNSITNATAYYLDIATDSGFLTFVSGYNNLYIGYYPSSGYFAGSLPAGVLYYRVRATNVCNVTTGNSNTVSFQTTAPVGGTVSPAQTICAGATPTSSLTLSGHTTTAGTVITNWQSATDAAFTTNVGYISETTNVLTSAKIGVLNVSTYFRAVVQNQFGSWCSTNSTPVLITVNNSVSAASSSPTLCVNTLMTNITHTTSGFIGISNSGVSGANGLPAGVSASFTSNVVTISGTPTASGTFNYSIPLTGGSCGAANATGTIKVNNVPTIASITAPAAFCAGGSLNPTAPAVTANGSSVTSQGWQISTTSGGSTYVALTLPYTVAFADNGKNIRYFATNSCGTTNGTAVAITVNDKPTIASITSPSALCAGSSLNPTAPAVTANGSSVTSQGWQISTTSGGSTYVTLALPYTVAFADNGKNIRYFATNSCGTTNGTAVAITVNDVPAIASITAPAALCVGSSLNPTAPAVTANGSSVTSQGWQISTTSGGSTYVALTLPYTVAFADNGKNIRYFATNSCGTTNGTAVAITVNNVPAIASITSPAALCAGSSLNPTAPAVTANGSSVTSQGWQISTTSGGSTYVALTLPYTVAFADNGKNVRYFATNSCGTTNGTAVAITVNNVPAVASITSPAALCAGSSLNPTAPAVTANGSSVTSQGWQISTTSGGSTYVTLTLPYTVAFADNGKNIRYFATNSCGTTNGTAVAITVNDKPTIASITSPAALCAGSSLNPTAPAVTANGSSVTSQGWQISTTSGGSTYVTLVLPYTVAFADNGKNIRYSATNSCGMTNGTAVAITVNPAPTLGTAAQTIFACDNSPATIKLTGLQAGSTFIVDYTIGGNPQTAITGLTAPAGEASFTTRNLTAADDGALLQITGITITSASPGCTKSFAGIAGIDLNLKVKSNSGDVMLNGTSFPSGSTTYSELTSAVFKIDPIAGASGYTWAFPDTDWIVTAGAGTNEITVTTGTYHHGGNVTVTANNMLCPSSLMVALTSIAPPAPIPTAPIQIRCSTLGSITLNGLPAGNWTLHVIKDGVTPGTDIFGTGTTYPVTNLTSGVYTFTVSNSFGTSVVSATVNINEVTKTWDGSNWVTGSPAVITSVPTSDDIVVFASDYIITTPLNACSCTINPGVKVVVGVAGATNANAVLIIQNGLKVDGSLTFENGASLIQNNDAKNINTGNIIYKRTATSIKDFDYVYWSSPVSGQTLGALSPSSDKYWSWLGDYWTPGSKTETMIEGKGYIARVPRYVTSQTVNFIGTPNNGDVTIAVQGDDKSNLIGNPYPSAISADDFMIDNIDVLPDNPLLSFWAHNSARKLSDDGTQYEYVSEDYASYNLSGGTAAETGGLEPDGTIAAGQSFMVGSVTDFSNEFKFTNSMRIGDVGKNSNFFKQANTKKAAKLEKNRVWLNLSNAGGAFKQLLVGYITGATNEADKLFDGTSLNSNAYVDFYSIMNQKNYSIQGRSLPFNEEDEVPLGYKSTIEGTFEISIDKTDGFMAKQAIYLEDKTANVIHDLTKEAYSFSTAKGEFKDRFVLRYTNTTKLGTGDFDPKGKGVVVSVKDSQIKVNSFDKAISSVKVYDLKGSMLFEKDKVDKNEFLIDRLASSSQFMIVMIQLDDGKWVSEEIIFHD